MLSTLNKFSKLITQTKKSGPAQSMLYALGLTHNDLKKAQVGIGTVYLEGNPCNSKLPILSDLVKTSLQNKNLLPMRFNTIGISDGMSMGTSGMSYSLPSRELIADSFETVVRGQHYDSLICIPGCDKNLPASAMALARLNRPGFIIYGGSMKPNYYKGKPLDIVSSFNSYGEYLRKEIDDDERTNIVKQSCHGDCGSCSGFYTANTMGCILEVMGLTLPNGSSNMSMSSEKFEECNQAGKIIKNLLINDIKPLDIMTREAFLNAIKLLFLIGGSTNGVIHLLAMAKTAKVELTLEDFKKYEYLPVITNMKPHGKYVMNDLSNIGGTKYVIKYLIDQNIINGDCLTITGKTLSENLSNVNSDFINNDSSKIIHRINDPFKKSSHINILTGNLAPNGSVSKIYSEKKMFSGKAKVYNTEKAMLFALEQGEISSDNFVILRYQGESIGCPEMLSPTSALVGYFGDKIPPLATDGRFSGGSSGILVAHLPDAYKKESITALIQDEDMIKIDLNDNTINIEIDNNELKNRKTNLIKPELKLDGYLAKYSKLVTDLQSGYLN